MIDLYYWMTPNGHKAGIMVEELGIEYNLVPVNIGRGDQLQKEYLEISPNNKIPAIVDHFPRDSVGPISIFESGAILLYLAEKTDRFIPRNPGERYLVLQWLFWQTGNFGPLIGQNEHFVYHATEQVPYAINRYLNEASRLYAVLDKRLDGRDYIADEFSIADIATYPWTVGHQRQRQNLDEFPNVKRWHNSIKQREAVKRAYAIPESLNVNQGIDEQAAKILFGQDKSVVRR